MQRVKGVEDLNIRIICTQGILGVGANTRTFIASFQQEVFLRIIAVGYAPAIRFSCR